MSEMCSYPNIFNLHGPCTGKDAGEVRLRNDSGLLSFGTVQITDLDFADAAVILAETTGVLAGHSIC